MCFACHHLLFPWLRSSECHQAVVSYLITVRAFTALVLKPSEARSQESPLHRNWHPRKQKKPWLLWPRPSSSECIAVMPENVLETTGCNSYRLAAFTSLAPSTSSIFILSALWSHNRWGNWVFETQALNGRVRVKAKIFQVPTWKFLVHIPYKYGEPTGAPNLPVQMRLIKGCGQQPLREPW